jgi:hypothetical protein
LSIKAGLSAFLAKPEEPATEKSRRWETTNERANRMKEARLKKAISQTLGELEQIIEYTHKEKMQALESHEIKTRIYKLNTQLLSDTQDRKTVAYIQKKIHKKIDQEDSKVITSDTDKLSDTLNDEEEEEDFEVISDSNGENPEYNTFRIGRFLNKTTRALS